MLQLYRRQLDERRLHSDPAQLAVVAKLDDLRRRLIAQRRVSRARLPHWLSGLVPAAARAPLTGLFDELFRRGVTLVATSNVPPQELYRDGLQRQRFLPAIGLLERHLEVVRLAGATEYRLRQLTEAGINLPAGAPDSGARLVGLFAALADTQAQAGGVIEIEARPIAVLRAAAGAVWFDFRALCAAPRSQSDYIEIAREYRSVLVSDVPALGAARDDEARRSIAFIDELYDRNVNLIVSAAAPPAELYRGERLRALFARTTSRLIEMQSEEYLAREHRP